ncbi:proline-specific peptidase [Coniophora puteana RWD-64-598 SS2]|uniref:Proline-specific peptidase n=1 Tax=Coniophora puteana (strain RWD-64-598) TaxID=741705 RepID=A0A5M3MJL2_CONPW|nr:proline-specific peptidase [Coniophora puteana RWD-64-598 SS2]EIW79439.1 proline-specific peptidase [Coniophora puteana RWD-64-598 SS2]
MKETTGLVDFVLPQTGEACQTWYRIVGELTPDTTPLVILHGGPGMDHVYMLPHIELTRSYGIPVIFYDQIGIGKSTHLPTKPREFWTMDPFMDELDNLLKKLGVSGRFDLLGHSWGVMLAADYASLRQPSGLRKLILSSGLPSTALWEEAMHRHLSAWPPEFGEMVLRHEREGTTDAEEYKKAMDEFSAKHVCQVQPTPQQLTDSFAAMYEDLTVYNNMFGSEIEVLGTMKGWSCIDRLHSIKCETLITNGRDDGAQDSVVEPFFQKIAGAKWVRFLGSHIPFFEDTDSYFLVVGRFLTT